jgi:serine/threonine protein phosphatase 1
LQPRRWKIIFLGDYIDRGPDNYGALQTVMNPPENWEFVCLLGNHESMFLESYKKGTSFYNRKAALDIAGYSQNDTQTYQTVLSSIPRDVIEWMHFLKLYHIEDNNVFAHAYYDDSLSPENQVEYSCVWYRMHDSEPYNNQNQGLYLTHGHTPKKNGPIMTTNRLNLDAGAVFYGKFVIAEYHKNKQGPVAFYEFLFEDHPNF